MQYAPMSPARYVCLSDLHLGAENSLLSNVAAGDTTVDLSAPSPVLVQFVECLASLLERLAGDSGAAKPTLVLNGDVLELALARDEIALGVFTQFLELAFERHDLFDPVVVYLPGNHDHMLWGPRLDQTLGHVGANGNGTTNGESGWTTKLFDSNGSTASHRNSRGDLLTAAAHQREGLRHLEFELRYPAYAVETTTADGGTRVVAFHHGHFTEASSASISALRRATFPRESTSPSLWDRDDESSPWVEFVWSTLARPGAFGADVGVVHAMIQDPRGARVVAANLGQAAGGVLPAWVPPQLRRTAGRVLLSRVAKKVAADERSSPTAPLSTNSGDGLRDFLNGPLWHQLRVVEGHDDPEELVFVFGHTHKPFCDTLRYAGYGAPIARYNTGGWVVDSLRPLPGHGGAVLLLDGELRAANVEVFRRHGSANVVAVNSASSEHEEFAAHVRTALEADGERWSELCGTIDDETPHRYRSLRAMIAEGLELAAPR
jgi:hypothetical protein